MKDGTSVLVPIYVYTGSVVGQSYDLTFTVIPVDSQYLNLADLNSN